MGRRFRCAVCWAQRSVNRRLSVAALLAALALYGCGGQKKSTIGLDVDVYMHPTSADPADILLQAGISKRLAEDIAARDGLIHVRVADGLVILSGAVKSDNVRQKAEQIAQSTDVRINGEPVLPQRKISNQIEVEP